MKSTNASTHLRGLTRLPEKAQDDENPLFAALVQILIAFELAKTEAALGAGSSSR